MCAPLPTSSVSLVAEMSDFLLIVKSSNKLFYFTFWYLCSGRFLHILDPFFFFSFSFLDVWFENIFTNLTFYLTNLFTL